MHGASLFVMNVKEWLKATKKQMCARELAIKEAGTTPEYIKQLSSGVRSASPKLAIKLENSSSKHTPHAVMRKASIRPDIWSEPEAA